MRTSIPYYIAAALCAAALSGRPAAGEPAGPLEPPSMPELAEISDLSGEAAESPEAMNAYQAGVQAYLNGKDDDAVASLREALRIDPGNEKAERLLLKVLLRGINDNYAAGNYRKARVYVQEARKRFPSNPEVKLLYSSVQDRGAAAREEKAASETGPAPEKRGAGSADRRTPLRRAAPGPAETLPAGRNLSPERPPASAAEKPKPAPQRFPPLQEHLPALGGGLLTAVFLLFFYLQQRQQKALLQQVENLQKALSVSQKEKEGAARELEIWKGFGKQVEELELKRKTREQSMYLELEKMKAEEERKIIAELAEKRRELDRLAALEAEARRMPRPAPPPAPIKSPPPPITTPREAETAAARTQEDRILDIMMNIAPPEREAAWERITAQSMELYAAAPGEAVKFFRAIAGDKNPLNRASITGALAGIGSPETIEILLALYRDTSQETRREAIKQMSGLAKNGMENLAPDCRDRISACLKEEKEKGEWIF